MALSLDPEFQQVWDKLVPILTAHPPPEVGDIKSRREGVGALFDMLTKEWPETDDIERSEHSTKSADGYEISISRFATKGRNESKPQPAVVYTHGGGYIMLAVKHYERLVASYVRESGVQFFVPEYRLAPESAHPKPTEDCYAALEWVSQHAKDFNIDPARITIMGDSAGGGLAAGVTIMARDKGLSPPLAKQMLIAAMLDDTNTNPKPELINFATWTVDDNITGWQAYVGDKAGSADCSPYAAPTRVKSVEGLPSTYMEVPGLDIFRNENIAYAQRLYDANVVTEFHVWAGVPHSWEIFSPQISISKAAIAERIRVLKAL